MTQNTNGFCDVTEFLYSPNEANELLNNENVIQSSDNFFLEDLGPNVIDCSNLSTCPHSSSNSPLAIPSDDLESQTSFLNSYQNISASNSNKLVYENLSAVVR